MAAYVMTSIISYGLLLESQHTVRSCDQPLTLEFYRSGVLLTSEIYSSQ